MDKMFKKGILKDGRTGRTTGSNRNAGMKTNAKFDGLGALASFAMDVVDSLTEDSKTRTQVRREAETMISAYTERAGSKYVVIVSFADKSTDRKVFSYKSDAERLIRRLHSRTNTVELNGSIFDFGDRAILVDRRYIEWTEVRGMTLYVRLTNDVEMKTTYTSKYKLESDECLISPRRTYRQRQTEDFSILSGIDKILRNTKVSRW